jgi:hypothetical protein
MSVRFTPLCVLLLCLFASFSFGQQGSSSIVGTVTDPSGAAVAGAEITITNTNTGTTHTLTSNSVGAYQLPNVEVGTYSISVKNSGFKTFETTGVTVNVSSTVRVDIPLQLGQTSENITVSAEALQVQSESSEQSNLITSNEIENIATNGRNVINLATIGTGVSSALPSFNQPTSVTASSAISFNGQRPQHNIWLIDGGENYDRGAGGGISTMPSQDAIGEFRVLTSNYSADYGFASGGTVSMVLKSGTKDFHGSAWEFFRNDGLDANNYIANTNGQAVPKLRYNVYGWNLGGPIFIPGHYNKDRNKTFFFWNEEWRSDIQGTQSSTITDPTASERAGIFNTKVIDPTTGLPFPTNAAGQYVIPTSRMNPQALNLLGIGIFPNPTSVTAAGVGQYSTAPAEPIKLHEEIIRVDHQFNEKWSIMGHFIDDMTNQSFATSLWSSDNVPTVGSKLHSPSYAGVIRVTDLISPSAVNEVTLQYDGNRLLIAPTGLYSSSAVTNNEYFPGNNLNRLPNIYIAGNYGINYGPSWQPWWNAYNAYQVGDNFTLNKGTHNFKFGGNYMWFQKNQDGFTNTEGTYNFDGSASGNAFADFLLGDAVNYSEASAQPRIHTQAKAFSLYAMDDWHVSSRLTLNLGVRYEGIPQTQVSDNGVSDFFPNLYNRAQAPAFTSSGALNPYTSAGGLAPGFTLVPGTTIPYYSNGLGTTGQPGIPRQFVQNHWNNYGPRVGFAYDVAGNGKTVIRSGFGMFYERIQGNDLYNMISNPPFATTPTANQVVLGTPSVSYVNGATASLPVFPAGLGQALAANDFKNPTSMQWSFNIQQQLASHAVFSLAYVGNENYHQADVRNINTPVLGGVYQTGVINGSISPSANNQPFNQYPGFAQIPLVEDATNSNYNSLQAGLQVRNLHGLTLNIGYTWSHELDYMSSDLGGNINGQTMDNQSTITNPFNRGYDYGSGDMNRTQIFTAAYVYELPFFRHSSNGFAKNVVGGWELSGITTVETGVPVTVYMSNGNSVGLGTNDTINRPNVAGSVSYPQTFQQWFNPADFSAPANGQFGNLGRGSLMGPGRQNWDMTLIKKFGLGFREGANLTFRADAFNVFNHTQYSAVGTTFGQSTLGQVTSVYDPRVLQLGLTLAF